MRLGGEGVQDADVVLEAWLAAPFTRRRPGCMSGTVRDSQGRRGAGVGTAEPEGRSFRTGSVGGPPRPPQQAGPRTRVAGLSLGAGLSVTVPGGSVGCWGPGPAGIRVSDNPRTGRLRRGPCISPDVSQPVSCSVEVHPRTEELEPRRNPGVGGKWQGGKRRDRGSSWGPPVWRQRPSNTKGSRGGAGVWGHLP